VKALSWVWTSPNEDGLMVASHRARCRLPSNQAVRHRADSASSIGQITAASAAFSPDIDLAAEDGSGGGRCAGTDVGLSGDMTYEPHS
jgi:hypothetical protein